MAIAVGRRTTARPKTKRRGLRFNAEARTALLFLAPAFVGFLVFYAVPAVRGFYLSFTDFDLLKNSGSWVGLDNYRAMMQDTLFWNPPPGNPGTPVLLFNGTIYYRGGMTLQALREKVGEFNFSRIIRDWATQNRYGNVTTPQFIAHAERISGQSLRQFFDAWLYQEGKPTSW